MKKLLVILSYMALMQSICTPAFSQNCGRASIDSAMYMYNIGRYDECINGLNACLHAKHGFDFDQKVQAYHLLAICYLAVDSINDADSSIENLLALKGNFEPVFGDPERFLKELTLVKSKPNGVTISSVSKRPEDIRLAPATAMVITQEEILQRGYTDLINVLKDLPGFDISTYYGQTYANVYQRGLRTHFTDKILILIDGVEDNDLWSYFADISQQYPITNIKRIEVIYGPASTMYGPNAFSGVINIITKEPADYMKSNHSFGIHANAGIGSYNTKYFDASVAYKKGIFSMSLTGRVYYSDRPDLSSQIWWDYKPSYYDSTNYRAILSVTENAQDYINTYHLPLISNLYKVYFRSGVPDKIILTDQGAELSMNYDKAAYAQILNNVSVRKFENTAQSSYVDAKISIGDLSLGFVSWQKEEGAGTTYTDRFASVSGTEWFPSHKYVYGNYNKFINQKLLFSGFLNYKIHTIQNGSKISELQNYATRTLELKDLVDSTPSYFATTYYYEQSEQFRSEFKLLYAQGENFYAVGGVELRNSQLQGYYLVSPTANPKQDGTYSDTLPGGNQFDVNDIGVYAQGQYRTKNKFGFTAGGRLDYNQIRQSGGLGYTFSPRFVVDKVSKTWVFKAIFSKGIKNVSNFIKFNDVGTLAGNPGLKAESIYNYEISVNNKISKAFTADIDIYYSDVKNIVKTIFIAPFVRQNINLGEYKILGIQANLYYTSQKIQASANYSFTYPKETKDTFTLFYGSNSVRIADIAAHKANAVINYIFLNHYNINLRVNYVGSKKAGPGTTVVTNEISSFPAYVLGNIALSANDLFKLKGTTFQFLCNNIFDKKYYSPGIIGASGKNYPGSVLQMERNFSFRIGYEF